MWRKYFKVDKEDLIFKGGVKEKNKKDMKLESSWKKSKLKCWNYGKTDHIQKDCKDKKKKKMESSSNSKSSLSDDEDTSSDTLANQTCDDD